MLEFTPIVAYIMQQSEESDSDYVPAAEDEAPVLPSKAKDPAVLDKAKHAWAELKESKQETRSTPGSLEEAMAAARQVKQAQQQTSTATTVTYAGQAVEMLPAKRERKSLDAVVEEVTRPKSVNSVVKSHIDWERFKATHKVEDILAKNRKDGFLQKQEFLLNSKERAREHYLALKRKK